MDVGSFVQENKRWLIGCAIGGLAFLIANIVIGSIYNAGAEQSTAAGLMRAASKNDVYPKAAVEAAREEAELLQKERERLQAELAFVPSATYQLAGKGAADEYMFQVGRTLKTKVLNLAGERDVQLAEKDVSWPPVTGLDEIRGVLFGLELLDEASQRLFAAHDAVRSANPDAMGLRAILQLKTDDRRAQRGQGRGGRPGEVSLGDYVVQERLLFQFQSDAATLAAFLEACRKPGRTLTIETVTVTQPQRLGDPVQVKGSLQGIAFKEAK
ncbi:MAG: hypothetical protein KA020_03770 [Planctomycetes bacterium]|jgi:hypothetical protein|nr:hypothetical protein [Planctomycetota bacterium]MCC7061469.1 hypothetical protein [Planctomycetota bacterium]